MFRTKIIAFQHRHCRSAQYYLSSIQRARHKCGGSVSGRSGCHQLGRYIWWAEKYARELASAQIAYITDDVGKLVCCDFKWVVGFDILHQPVSHCLGLVLIGVPHKG